MAHQRARRTAAAAALALLTLTTAVLAGPPGPASPATGSRPTSPSSSGPVGSGSTTGSRPTDPAAGTPTPTGGTGVAQPAAVALPAGLTLRAGTAARPASAGAPVVPGTVLTPAAVAQVVDRLPAWVPAALAQAFRWPTPTLDLPSTRTTVTSTFPGTGDGQGQPTTPTPTPTGPLQVLRLQPQGEVSVAPFVSITFNQPMVAVGTVGQVAADRVPATITPSPAGRWDWIGTSTLRFSADPTQADRLPMATRFTVTVPAGTASVSGARLARAVSGTFTTPPPAVLSFLPRPDTPAHLRPVLVAVFNQRVDPATVVRTLAVTAGGRAWSVRPAGGAEIDADPDAAAAVAAAPAGRAAAFVPTSDFPAGVAVTVGVAAGTRSAEGPLVSTRASTFSFHTYEPMTSSGASCADFQCEPGAPITVTWANPIDLARFDPGTVAVSPALPGGASVTAAGNRITISGATQASTTYRVTVRAGLADVFGQTSRDPVDDTAAIGAARPQIQPFATPVSTVDPTTTPALPVVTVGHRRFRERVFAVGPDDWPAFAAWWVRLQQLPESYRPGDDPGVPAWTQRSDTVIPVSGNHDAVTVTEVNLADALSGGSGQVVVLIEPIDPAAGGETWQNRPIASWVQATTLAVDGLADATGLHAWVTDLRTGRPVAGATVTALDPAGRPVGKELTTDAAGLAATDIPAGGVLGLRASAPGRSALLLGNLYGGPTWSRQPAGDRLLWFVTDDRQTYRPGETVSLKGWVRRQAGGTGAALTTPGTGPVTWSATDADGSRLGTGRVTLDRAGGFTFTLDLPAGTHLGVADIELQVAGMTGVDQTQFGHPFTVADFRTPAFEVSTHPTTTDPAVRGTPLAVQADATYYAGGPLGQAPVQWQVRTATASYAPPGWDAFTFGLWTPWWTGNPGGRGRMSGFAQPCCGGTPDQPANVRTFAGTTDGNGSDDLDVTVGDLGRDTAGLPVDVVAQATVTDVDRQEIAGTTEVLVHPAADYVGLATDSTYVAQGRPLTVRAVVTTIDGAVAAGRPITMTAARVAGGWAAGTATDTLVDARTCAVTSGAAPVSCTFTPTVGGEYRITATVTDTAGRSSRTQLSRWVAGPDGAVATTVTEQAATVIPDRPEYQPGQTAHLLVASPVTTGTGLLTLSHGGIVTTSTFAVSSGSAEVAVPVGPDDLPGLTADVEVVGTAPGPAELGGGARPAYATGRVQLAVSRQSRALTVRVSPRQSTVTPGGRTTLDVSVADAAGHPVAGSQFEVTVVDEAVLALAGSPVPDPLAAFYPDDSTYLTSVYGRSMVVLGPAPRPTGGVVGASSAAASAADSGAAMPVPAGRSVTSGSGYGFGRAEAGTPATAAPIPTRTLFSALALFRPSEVTGADGTASIPVTLPDNLTRYRVLVVAVAGSDRFGTGQATLTAGRPLTVRPSPPRFLNFGDQAQLPVLVQNLTDAAVTARVVLQAANLTVVGGTAGAAGREVAVPAGGRVEVRFPVRADQAGTARFRVAVVSGSAADAAQADFPVYTPSTSETFATYGSLTGGTAVSQPLRRPADVVPAFGGLQVTTSSTVLSRLSDALAFVADDNFRSSDSLAAQVIAGSATADVLQAFSTPGRLSPDQWRALVHTDVAALLQRQNKNGGFPFWQAGEPSDPFVSIQVGLALLQADRHGLTGPAHAGVVTALRLLLPYLTSVDAALPDGTSAAVRDTVDASALAVRALDGDGAAGPAADRMAAARGAALPLDAVAWLLPVVGADRRTDLLTRVGNAAVDDSGTVSFTTAVNDDSWTVQQSDTRTDALVLDALLTVAPTSDLIPKIARGLFDRQQGGRWDTLSDNAYGLVALRHYFDVAEAVAPDLTAGVWLGATFAGQHRYAGRTTEQAQVDIPTSALLAAGDTTVTVADQGSGRLYYRVGLTTAPADLSVPALDRGFVVSRSYAGADSPGDVTRGADGVWHVKAGARVRVTVTLVSRSAQHQVALTDPLPAGLESLDPALATTPRTLAGTGADPRTWAPTWFDHQELRADRALAAATSLPGGVYTYSYLAAATTPGTFVVPPATAEQVYAPETFGRTATDRMVVSG